LPRNAQRLLAILAEKPHFVTDEVLEERESKKAEA
jgi:hypothetical protein